VCTLRRVYPSSWGVSSCLRQAGTPWSGKGWRRPGRSSTFSQPTGDQPQQGCPSLKRTQKVRLNLNETDFKCLTEIFFVCGDERNCTFHLSRILIYQHFKRSLTSLYKRYNIFKIIPFYFFYIPKILLSFKTLTLHKEFNLKKEFYISKIPSTFSFILTL